MKPGPGCVTARVPTVRDVTIAARPKRVVSSSTSESFGTIALSVSAETMNRISKAAEKVERFEPRLAEARAELHEAIRQAHSEGASLGTISRVAGLSRERIRQLVKPTD